MTKKFGIFFKKGLLFCFHPAIINKRSEGGKPTEQKQNMGVFPSGQWGQTVNLLLFSFGGSNPPAPTKKVQRMKVR